MEKNNDESMKKIANSSIDAFNLHSSSNAFDSTKANNQERTICSDDYTEIPILQPIDDWENYEKQMKQNNKDDVLKSKQKTKKRIKRKVKVIFFLFIICIIGILSFLFYVNNPKVITKNALKSLKEELLKILPKEHTIVGNDFSIDVDMITKLESDYILQNYSNDNKISEYYSLLNNLNQSKINTIFMQDSTNKKLYYQNLVLVNNQTIIDDRYLIENSTAYYFVKDFFDKYVNTGNNNYFEAITKDINAYDNILYLYRFILTSITNQIEDSDFVSEVTTTSIDGKIQDVEKLSITLDNDKMKRIVNGVLKDLKSDKRGFKVISCVYDNFSSFKIAKNTVFLQNNDKIVIHLYTQGFLHKAKKYEVTWIKDEKSLGLSYEIESKIITILEDNQVSYYINYTNFHNTIKGKIMNSNDSEIGNFEFDNQDIRKQLLITFRDRDYSIHLDIDSRVNDKTDISYKNKILVNIQIEKNNQSYLKGTIELDAIIKKQVNINTEVSDVLFQKELTDEVMKQFDEFLKNRLKRIY